MKMKGFFPSIKHSIYAPPTQLREKKQFQENSEKLIKIHRRIFHFSNSFLLFIYCPLYRGLEKTSWHGTWYAIRFFLDFGNLFSKCSFAVFVVVHFILLIPFHPKIVVRCYSCPFTKNVFAFGRAARFHEEMHQLFQVRM